MTGTYESKSARVSMPLLSTSIQRPDDSLDDSYRWQSTSMRWELCSTTPLQSLQRMISIVNGIYIIAERTTLE